VCLNVYNILKDEKCFRKKNQSLDEQGHGFNLKEIMVILG